jgi:hypothetical protein
MKQKIGKKKTKTQLFDSIRKPIAPPSKIFGENKPLEKALPSLRKVKYKKEIEVDKED